MDVKTSVLIVDGKYQMVTLDYVIKGEDNASSDKEECEAATQQKLVCLFILSISLTSNISEAKKILPKGEKIA